MDQRRNLDLLQADPGALRRRLGLPHPLSKFAARTGINDGIWPDAILKFIHTVIMAEPGTMEHKEAHWFLFESQTFLDSCAKAGIEAGRLRRHLRRCEQRWRGA